LLAPDLYSVNVTSLWRMWLATFAAGMDVDAAEAFLSLYVLFPRELTDFFNGDTVPMPPRSTDPKTHHTTTVPSEQIALRPLSDAKRRDLFLLFRNGRTQTLLFTALRTSKDTVLQQRALVSRGEVTAVAKAQTLPRRRTFATRTASGATVITTSNASMVDVSSIAPTWSVPRSDMADEVQSWASRRDATQSPERNGGRPPIPLAPSRARSPDGGHQGVTVRLMDINRKRSKTCFSPGNYYVPERSNDAATEERRIMIGDKRFGGSAQGSFYDHHRSVSVNADDATPLNVSDPGIKPSAVALEKLLL
jgi:hypothetical protein